jgi:hypothetical protein
MACYISEEGVCIESLIQGRKISACLLTPWWNKLPPNMQSDDTLNPYRVFSMDYHFMDTLF